MQAEAAELKRAGAVARGVGCEGASHGQQDRRAGTRTHLGVSTMSTGAPPPMPWARSCSCPYVPWRRPRTASTFVRISAVASDGAWFHKVSVKN